MKATRLIGLAAVAAAAVACFAITADELKPGTAAPKFTGETADGKSFALSSALKDKPVLVYFMSTSCPVSKAAMPHYGALAKAYEDLGLTVVGVLNDGKAGYEKWNKIHNVKYPVVLDPSYEVIKAYHIAKAPSAVLVGKNGMVIKAWTGYSKQILMETNQMAAAAVGKTAPVLEFSGAPASWQAG